MFNSHFEAEDLHRSQRCRHMAIEDEGRTLEKNPFLK